MGTNILIMGTTPTLPMSIEQAVSSIFPADECRIDSFEIYDDALDYCKQRKDVGFVLLLDDFGNKRPTDIFNNLLAPYESRGLPGCGILLYMNQPNIRGFQSYDACPGLLEYAPVTDFLNPDCIAESMNRVWHKFQTHLEVSVPVRRYL